MVKTKIGRSELLSQPNYTTEGKADLAIVNCNLLNVYSGELLEGWEVAVKGKMIAYVGKEIRSAIGTKTEVIDAKGKTFDEDVIVLMQSIYRNVGTLRQMEGPVLTAHAKEITQHLPTHVDDVPRYGEGGLNERLLKINGLVGRDRMMRDRWFWLGLFFMFAVTGFFILLILLEFM